MDYECEIIVFSYFFFKTITSGLCLGQIGRLANRALRYAPGRFASFPDLSHRKLLFQKKSKDQGRRSSFGVEGAPSALRELPRRRGSSCVGTVTPKELLRFYHMQRRSSFVDEGAPSAASITRELPRRNSSCVVTHAPDYDLQHDRISMLLASAKSPCIRTET